jgi:hypothetical protein
MPIEQTAAAAEFFPQHEDAFDPNVALWLGSATSMGYLQETTSNFNLMPSATDPNNKTLLYVKNPLSMDGVLQKAQIPS